MISMISAIRLINSSPKVKLDDSSRGKRTRYGNDVVHKALEMCRQNQNYGFVGKALGVSRNTVRDWVKKYSFDDASTLYKSIKTYEPAFVARRNKVIKLVTGNPLGSCEISKILGCDSSTIRNDILALINSCDIVNVSKNGNVRVVVAV